MIVLDVTLVPPFSSVYQPTKLWLALSEVGNVPIAVLTWTCLGLLGTAEPPWVLKVTSAILLESMTFNDISVFRDSL